MKNTCLIFIFFFSSLVFGQDSNIKFPTTPEVAKFAEKIEYPIDINTGGIQYNVPLYQLSNGNISFDLNLNYSSRGVKVSDISSEFGQDWSLNIPQISREVRGIPDEFAFGFLSPEQNYSTADMASKAFRNNPYDQTTHPDNDISYQQDIYNRAYNGTYDLQPDKFYFNLNGKSGYFMFKDETKEIITYPLQDLKIHTDLPNSIKIIDSDGTEYHFGNSYNSLETNNNNNFTTGWYITKISNFNNEISFNYDNSKIVYYTLSDEYKTINTATIGGFEPVNQFPSNKIITPHIINKPLIKDIIYKNLKINFSYTENDNYTGIKKIEKISVLDRNSELYSYLFNLTKYTTVDETINTNNISTRTFLNKILLKDSNKIEEYYSFEYHDPENLPTRLSLKQDLWGFYNNNTYSTIIPSYILQNKIHFNSDRTVFVNFLKKGILKTIILPTKGSIQIETEPNQIKREFIENIEISNTKIGSVALHLEEDGDFIYQNLARIITEPIPDRESDENSLYPTAYQQSFSLSENSLINLRIIKQFASSNCLSIDTACPTIYLKKHNYIKTFSEDDDNTIINLEAGNYTLFVENLTPSLLGRKDIVIQLSHKIRNELKKNINVNGLRIKSISHYDKNQLVLKKLYNYNDYNGNSSGHLINLSTLSKYHYTGQGGEYYTTLHSFFNNGLNSNSSSVLYSEVSEEKINILNNTSNKIIFTYFTPFEQTLVPRLDRPNQVFAMLRSFYTLPVIYPYIPSWRQKLLKSKAYYNNDKIVKKTIFNYVNSYNKDGGKFNYNYSISQSMGEVMPLVTEQPSEQQYLSEQITTEYFENSTTPVKTEIIYNYDSSNHLQLTKQTTKNSKGETLTTEYKYPSDLATNTNTIWDDMVDRNMIANPIETKISNNSTVLSEQRTTFNYFPGTNNTQLILPQFVYNKKGAMGNDVNIDDKKITYNSYDNKGNITQYTPENGIPVSIIWGYNGQYPIAKIEGANYSEISNYIASLENQSNLNSLTNDSFNDLRNALPNAMVTGYTYKPLIGVTSITGPNGLTEFYEYDSAGRLEVIRNHKNEILKTFKYNYKN